MKSNDQELNKIPAEVYSRLAMSLAEMEKSLLTFDPDMKTHLQESHRLIVTYPETVHLLDDDEIHKLIEAAERLSKTQIVKDTASKSTAGQKKKIAINDI